MKGRRQDKSTKPEDTVDCLQSTNSEISMCSRIPGPVSHTGYTGQLSHPRNYSGGCGRQCCRPNPSIKKHKVKFSVSTKLTANDYNSFGA